MFGFGNNESRPTGLGLTRADLGTVDVAVVESTWDPSELAGRYTVRKISRTWDPIDPSTSDGTDAESTLTLILERRLPPDTEASSE